MAMKSIFYLIILTLSWVCFCFAYEAPLTSSMGKEVVPDSFIIALATSCSLEQHFENIKVSKSDPHFNSITDLTSKLNFYYGTFPASELSKIRSDPCVIQVSANYKLRHPRSERPRVQPRSARSTTRKAQISRDRIVKRQPAPFTISEQREAPWNLAVIANKSQQQDIIAPDRVYSYNYSDTAGDGVDIYVLDTGFNVKHPEFEGRVEELDEWPTDNTGDPWDRAHGTCVLSIVGGTRYGVAKRANLTVLAMPDFNDILHAIAAIITRHEEKLNSEEIGPSYAGAIINLSIGAANEDPDYVLNTALKRADQAGVLVVGGAENHGLQIDLPNPPFDYPCVASGTICVGGFDNLYQRLNRPNDDPPVVSNYGDPITLWAPAYKIPCVNGSFPNYIENEMALSGNSWAGPHVTGTAAIMLGFKKSRKYATNTYWIKLLLLHNAIKLDGVVDPVAGVGESYRVYTGIMDAEQGQPFSEPDEMAMMTRFERRNFPDVKGPISSNLHCFDGSSGDSDVRIELTDAERLLLRARWERNSVGGYQSNGGHERLMPCINSACVYLKSSGPMEYVPINNQINFPDYIRHILYRCKSGATGDDGFLRALTGGSLELVDYPGLFIHLRKELSREESEAEFKAHPDKLPDGMGY